MCLAGSDKYLSVLEGECVYLPLPYKEDQALVTCFYWIQIRSELPERKNLQIPSFLLWCQILCIPAWHFLWFQSRLQSPGGMKTNEADYLRTFILTAQKTGFVPALALTLHLLSEVDGFLAAATFVSSSERHSASMQESPLCTFFIHCIYNVSLVE